MRYNFSEIEKKWQKLWEDNKSFSTSNDKSKPKHYVLEMFPYPSGKLHMGHLRNYSIGDAYARFYKKQGYNVLHPVGWDAFGLPAENAALQNNIHPGVWTEKNIEQMKTQFRSIGVAVDWDREIATCRPDYYKHEQAMFIDFWQNDLVSLEENYVNWDPVEQTVLANEQVENGRGWRSGALIERKLMKSWTMRITCFADELLNGLNELEGWADQVKVMQKNWIGKSLGALIHWQISEDIGEDFSHIDTYTTRPDTLFGASFVAIAAQHPLAEFLAKNNQEIKEFNDECNSLGTAEEAIETAEKKGIFTGLYVQHPFMEDKKIPVWIANFVLTGYGTGAVFGCPAHDKRDYEFATKYDLPITAVIENDTAEELPIVDTDNGRVINSDFLNGMSCKDAFNSAIKKLEQLQKGEAQVNFRLRDWGVSRQRYWGCPIPVIHCQTCGPVSVPKEDLPVTLPKDVDFSISGNPLQNHPTWKDVPCPKCGKPAQRETDTFDTFMESSWYFLRFCSPKTEDKPFDIDDINYWMPVDQYIGGIEHAVMHLLYARFFNRALKKIGYTQIDDEPFKNLLNQGMVNHVTYFDENKKWVDISDVQKVDNGFQQISTGKEVWQGRSEKMSKSKLNGVDPASIISSYGADAARLFVLSDNPPEKDFDWSEEGIEGAWRFINRFYRLIEANVNLFANKQASKPENFNEKAQKLWASSQKIIAFAKDDYKNIRLNTAIAKMREFFNEVEKFQEQDESSLWLRKYCYEILCCIFNPIIPHVTEELWSLMNKETLLVNDSWPEFDEKMLQNDTVKYAIQINGKLKEVLELAKNTSKEEVEQAVMQLPKVQSSINDKEIKKIIVVPNKIVNIVC